MVAFSTIKPGDVLYQVTRQRMGNTMMKRDTVFTVRIVEVFETHAMASWNGNSPRRFYPRDIAKLRRSKPKPKPTIWDLARPLPHPEDK